MRFGIPSAEQVRQRQESRRTATNRRKHYLARIAAAGSNKAQLAEAFDYLRATARTDDEIDQATTELVAMADRMGGVR